VLLHEMGHVVHRHSLQQLIQTSLVGAAIVVLSGDTNSVADMGLGIGSLLVSSHYSRNHEYEADAYAFEKMLLVGINPQAFVEIMQRMQDFMSSTQPGQSHSQTESLPQAQVKSPVANMVDYFSSHPSTDRRVQQAKTYHQCFALGLTVCEQQ
jgi:Zn-dependent protease with chaperone function